MDKEGHLADVGGHCEFKDTVRTRQVCSTSRRELLQVIGRGMG